ncbi:diacylglycerol kinase [Pseudorhizobium flavum]|uniref:Diacylglycerol kinase n=1 Tax=Pseudorhizobium flavum TaxID=1335061 RepID=A0A7W9Z1K4_9HYPH|nr:diacylglycerol kinase [Pseudorhizobium flavum]MBB6182349.1 diacylglycerol kinase (ATP) [Pseudorhizobium flavum]CAD6632026.1 diacylglycerol kinase [Pseudorhizobium flavum]
MQQPTDRTFRLPPRRTGLAHAFDAARYSLNGMRRLFAESAFRQELLAALGVFGLFALAALPAHAFLIQFVLFCLLFAVEALNTAIEVIVDRVSPEYSSFAKDGKDLGSVAVFALLVANGATAAWFLSSAF